MLTNTETRELAVLLKARAVVLRNSIRCELLNSDQQHYLELAGRVHDSGDEAVADLSADMHNPMVARDAREVLDIHAALSRMSHCSYGICADCGCQIPHVRLRANPTVNRCFCCQQTHQRTFDGAGRPSL